MGPWGAFCDTLGAFCGTLGHSGVRSAAQRGPPSQRESSAVPPRLSGRGIVLHTAKRDDGETLAAVAHRCGVLDHGQTRHFLPAPHPTQRRLPYSETRRRRAERLLVEQEKLALVGQLATSIAHEINNPLEAVLNLLYLIRESASLDDAHGFAAQAEEEVQRAAQIASNTLKFHTQQTKPASTNVVQLMESVLVLFKGKLAATKVALEVEPRGEPELICFAGEIRQVLANLIRNALDAMPSGGRLRVRVRPSTDWRRGESGVRITIADTGFGMSPETRRQIYDPFFTTKGTSGTGLGLWVTAGILARHRGSMHLRSKTTPGTSGTTFTLIFPMVGVERE